MKQLLSASLLILLFSCQSAPNQEQPQHPSTDTVVRQSPKPQDTIPQTRTAVATAPVDQYQEKTDDPLNDWYFRVRLYETKETFRYVIKMEFEEIRGTDTLKLPNLGVPPKPVLRKGDQKYSCIIGFMDQYGVFQEYKKVYVSGNSLKITALRQFRVVKRTMTNAR